MAEISSFDLDLSSILAIGETRTFSISGGKGATFRLEVKNEDGYYYNFITRLFQSTKSALNEKLSSSTYKGSIAFPLVTDDDQYDIYLFTLPGTNHAQYSEVRFGDGSIDINSTTGSNSLLMTKVIYQYTALTLTLNPFSPTSAITGTAVNDTISISTGEGADAQAFSMTFTAANDKALQIIKQPVHTDILAYVAPTLGAAPVDIPGENIYPTATTAFTGDDINGAITSGAVVRMDNTDLSAVIKVGDKITTPVTTDTVNGEVESGANVVMDAAVATKMAVGDQVTNGVERGHALNTTVITVTAINVGGNANKFTLSEAVLLDDGVTLAFSSKINRSLTTVTVVETSSTATDFTMSQAIQFRDNAPLTFFNQMNYRWPVNNFAHTMKPGFIVSPGGGAVAGTILAKYSDTTTVFAGTNQEKIYINHEVEAVDTLSLKPTITTCNRGCIAENWWIWTE